MGKRVAVKCFDAWKEAAAEQRGGRDAQFMRAVGRFRNRLAQEVFEVWCSFVEWRRRIFQRASHAIGPGRSLYLAWRAWVANAKESKMEEQREWFMSMVGDSLNVLVANAVREVLPEMGHTGMAAHLVDEIEKLKEKLMSGEEREERERQHRIRKILRSWKHAHTSRAFDGWRQLLAENKQLRTRAGKHWRNSLAASVWRRWMEMVEGVRQQREAGAKVLGRWRNRLTGAAFECWLETVRATLDERHNKLGRAVGRMRNRLLSLVFDSWRGLLKQKALVRQMHRRALLRMTYGVVSTVFWAWASDVQSDRNRRGVLLRKVAGRFRNRVLATAFDAWHTTAVARADGRDAQYAMAVNRFRNRLAVQALEIWCEFVAWRKRILVKAAHNLGPGRSLYLAWRTWVANGRELKREQERRWILEHLGDSKAWLIDALGEMLPMMLPDTSVFSHELADIQAKQARLQKVRTPLARMWHVARAACAACGARVSPHCCPPSALVHAACMRISKPASLTIVLTRRGILTDIDASVACVVD